MNKFIKCFIMLSKITSMTILICWAILLGLFMLGNEMSQYEVNKLEKEYYQLSIKLIDKELQETVIQKEKRTVKECLKASGKDGVQREKQKKKEQKKSGLQRIT